MASQTFLGSIAAARVVCIKVVDAAIGVESNADVEWRVCPPYAAKARSRCRAGDPRQYSCFCDGLVGADAGVLDHFAVADHF